MRLAMTRKIGFSSGLRYWLKDLNEQENRTLFGEQASPYNHGHNYTLEVTVRGSIDPDTGMILNIKVIDDLLQSTVVQRFDKKSINDEIPVFANKAPSIENLLLYIWELLQDLPSQVELESLILHATPHLYAERRNHEMTLTRQYEFAASHRLHAAQLSADENWQLFGKCTNPAGHGHNYLLEVTVKGEPDEKTGMLVDIEALDRCVEWLVLERYDHKNLNSDVPELQGTNPTSELVAEAIFKNLKDHVPAKLHRIRLHETARSVFEVTEGAG